MNNARTPVTVGATPKALQRARGLAEDDPDQLVDAVSTYRASPRQIELAAACEDAGGALLRVGRDSEAAALLDEAAAVHLSCGAIADLARVDAMLRADGIRRRRGRPAGLDVGHDDRRPARRTPGPALRRRR